MSIVQVVGTGGGLTTERSLFVGPRIPQEIRDMAAPLVGLAGSAFRRILQVVVSSLEGSKVDNSSLKELETDSLDEETIHIIHAGLYTLLRCALKIPLTSLKSENFKEDLLELRIPKEFIVDVENIVLGSKRPNIEKYLLDSRPRLPTLEFLRWRVDVAISTSVLNRVLEPSIFMETTLSNGRIHSFEVPLSKFHELRYNVAHVLKEMGELEKKGILKIQD